MIYARFDLQWDEILLKIAPEPPEVVLETLYTKQLEGCMQFDPTMNLYKLNISQEIYPFLWQAKEDGQILLGGRPNKSPRGKSAHGQTWFGSPSRY